MDKLKIIFEELQKKYPDVFDDDLIEKLNTTIEDIKEEEVDSLKEEIKSLKEKEEKDSEDKEDEYEEDDEKIEEEINHIINTLDIYLETANEEFNEEHGELIEKSIKSNVSFDIANKLQEVLSTHGIKSPEVTLEKEDYEQDINKLNKTISNLTEKLSKYENEGKKKEAIDVFEKVTKNLTYDNKEKVMELAKDFSIDNTTVFERKLTNIVELFDNDNKNTNKNENEKNINENLKERIIKNNYNKDEGNSPSEFNSNKFFKNF